jgi:hypothetical protein
MRWPHLHAYAVRGCSSGGGKLMQVRLVECSRCSLRRARCTSRSGLAVVGSLEATRSSRPSWHGSLHSSSHRVWRAAAEQPVRLDGWCVALRPLHGGTLAGLRTSVRVWSRSRGRGSACCAAGCCCCRYDFSLPLLWAGAERADGGCCAAGRGHVSRARRRSLRGRSRLLWRLTPSARCSYHRRGSFRAPARARRWAIAMQSPRTRRRWRRRR